MTANAGKAFQLETEFLSACEANFDAAKGKQLRGSNWQTARLDDGDRLRALMASNHNYDRELLKTLPSNRRVALHGFERRWGLFKRRTGVAIASVLSPLRHFATGSSDPGPPIDAAELIDHVRTLAGDRSIPHVIGVCSPTGFTDQARAARLEMPNVNVVLIEPDDHGGWRTTPTAEGMDERLLKIFDPEDAKQKVERVRGIIAESGADLLTGGLSVSAVARKTKLPEVVVRQGFEAVAESDPELRLTKTGGEVLLFRGASVQRREKTSMNVIDRIKQLFSGEGAEAEKINLLAERRAGLSQRRDRIYEDIGGLEAREAELLEKGKSAASQVPRRRLAAQLAQVRKDVARQNTVAAMLNQQINILSTDIHNLTLIQQGDMAKLPDTTELTENAVRAEEMLETLKADADLVGSLETEMEAALTSDEELSILREFEGVDQPSEPEKSAQREPVRPAPEPAQETKPVAEPAPPEPPSAARADEPKARDAEPS